MNTENGQHASHVPADQAPQYSSESDKKKERVRGKEKKGDAEFDHKHGEIVKKETHQEELKKEAERLNEFSKPWESPSR